MSCEPPQVRACARFTVALCVLCVRRYLKNATTITDDHGNVHEPYTLTLPRKALLLARFYVQHGVPLLFLALALVLLSCILTLGDFLEDFDCLPFATDWITRDSTEAVNTTTISCVADASVLGRRQLAGRSRASGSKGPSAADVDKYENWVLAEEGTWATLWITQVTPPRTHRA